MKRNKYIFQVFLLALILSLGAGGVSAQSEAEDPARYTPEWIRDGFADAGITLKYNGAVKQAWAVSPDRDGKEDIPISREGELCVLRISNLEVYKVLILKK